MSAIKQYFPALTGVRALAAYTVFLTHYNPFVETSWLGLLLREGNSGVTIFFVLSGFLIASRYGQRVELNTVWLLDYFRNRFARIYPVYFLLTSATFLVLQLRPSYDLIAKWASYSHSEKVIVMALNYSLTKAFFYPFVFTGIPQGWTLTIEECFYALAPLLLLGLTKSKHKYALIAAYGAALLTVGCAITLLVPHKLGFFNTFNFMFTYTFFGRCMEFMYGIGLAVFMQRTTVVSSNSTWYTWGGVAWIAACVIAGTFVNPTPPTLEAYSSTGIVFNNILLPLGVVSLFKGLITEQTWLRKLLETPLLDLLGKSSYAFYLIHLGIISAFLKQYVSANPAIIFVIMVGLSILVYRWVEEPMQQKLRANRRKEQLVTA